MTKEQEDMVLANLNLAHYAANKCRSLPLEFDDIRSVAYIGLVKAVKTFDAERGFTFGTYGMRVIMFEIWTYVRSQKKQEKVSLSLNAPIANTENFTLGDTIADPRDHLEIVERVVDLSDSAKHLTEVEWGVLAIKCKHPDVTQRKIAQMCGVSQTYISRIVGKIRRKMLGGAA